MLDSLIEVLFRYPPWVFSHGEITAGSSSLALAVAAAVVGCAGVALVTYRSAARARTRDRVVLVALRVLALALVLLALARPVLVVRAAVPQQNVVGVLLDDSRSMRIADVNGQPRSAIVRQQFGEPASPLLQALSDRYQVRLFRFSSSAERITDGKALEFAGTQSRLGESLQRAAEELSGLPIAGLVAVTDGADTTGGTLTDALLALKAAGVPVFTVGVGRDPIARDIQIGRVVTPRRVLKGTALVVDVAVDHRGFSGTTLPLNVESNGRILASEQVRLPRDGEPLTVRLRFTAEDDGAHLFRFRVPPQGGEALADNNVRETLIQVDDHLEKILYIEGEPRFEVKFARKAVDADKNLQLVVLQRTAENKYYRLHLDDPAELAGGFPRTRDELFAYRGLIIGSIEASAFTGDQLRMISEFVDRRGGGLLMLGGPHAFGEGGYLGTPVADALPVVFDAAKDKGSSTTVRELQVQATRAGATHAVTQLAASDRDSAARWSTLPPLTSVNAIKGVKPGTTVLLTGATPDRGEQAVLAFQRFGRGKAIALAVQDSWLWQLHSDIAVEDMTHETLWRQLLRWLVADVPERVAATTSADRLERGDTLALVGNVVDASYMPVNSAQVSASLTTPSGRTIEVPLQWTGERDGEYRARFVPEEEGAYDVRITGSEKGVSLGTGTTTFRVAPDEGEAFDAAMRASLLRRVAEDTGGRFYTTETMARLAEDLQYTERGVTMTEERDLWDMPALLLLLVGCVLGEWGYRRARGLA